MTGISTAALYGTLNTNATNIQTAWAASNVQQSSGLVSDTYGGLGAVSDRVVNFQTEFVQNQAWASNANTAGNKTQAIYSSLSTLMSTLTQFQTTLSGAISDTQTSSSTTAALQDSAASALSGVAGILNQTFGGGYLFSGTATDTKPVDLTSYPTGTLNSTTADTSYYQGNSVQQSVQVGSANTVTYGVLGNNSAIEEAMRAIGIAKQTAAAGVAAGTAANATTLQTAYDLMNTAIKGVANLQSLVNGNAVAIKNAGNTATTYSSYLSGVSADLTNVNVAQAAAQSSAYKTMLTASYKALADGLSVSLVSYVH